MIIKIISNHIYSVIYNTYNKNLNINKVEIRCSNLKYLCYNKSV